MRIQNLSELFETETGNTLSENVVNSCDINQDMIKNKLSACTILRASVSILVLNGYASMNINHCNYELSDCTLILLSSSHLFEFTRCSHDFRAKAIFVSREFTDSMDSTDMVYKRMKYEVMIFRNPVISLSEYSKGVLKRRRDDLTTSINDKTHKYRNDLILSMLNTFYIDVSNAIEGKGGFYEEKNLTRQESIIKDFIDLVVTNFRIWHTVDTYAEKLNLSTHYLTLLIKRVTGQSASDMIFDMLYSEARNLLEISTLSIQQISAELNFSDQSSFGKFFKRKSGISPREYRESR